MEKIYLYLDDERNSFLNMPAEFKTIVCRNYEEAIMMIDYCKDNFLDLYIDFDHDLGVGPSGYDVAKYLVYNMVPAHYHIHTMNPVGRANIDQLLEHYGYKKF